MPGLYAYRVGLDYQDLVKGCRLSRGEMAAVRETFKTLQTPIDLANRKLHQLLEAQQKGANVARLVTHAQHELRDAFFAQASVEQAAIQKALALKQAHEALAISLGRPGRIPLLETYVTRLQSVKAAMLPILGLGNRLAQSLTMGLGAFGVPIGIFGGAMAMRSVMRGYEGFHQAMASSLAITSEVSEGMRREMEDTALQIAFHLRYTGQEAAQAYYYLFSAGYNGAQALKNLPVVATFAQAGMFDLSRATSLLSDSQSALGLKVNDVTQNMINMQRVADVLVRANTLANASVEQFAISLTTKAAAGLKIVGKELEEGVAVLAAFADQGVKAENAGNALHIVMRDWQTKAIAFREVWKQIGVDVYDQSGEFRNIADVLEDLENALGGKNDEEQKAILLSMGFADRSIAYTQALLGTSQKIREYEAELRKAAGTTQDVADKQMPAMTKAINQMKAEWEAFKLSAGEPIALGIVGAEGSSLLSRFLSKTLEGTQSLSQGLESLGMNWELLMARAQATRSLQSWRFWGEDWQENQTEAQYAADERLTAALEWQKDLEARFTGKQASEKYDERLERMRQDLRQQETAEGKAAAAKAEDAKQTLSLEAATEKALQRLDELAASETNLSESEAELARIRAVALDDQEMMTLEQRALGLSIDSVTASWHEQRKAMEEAEKTQKTHLDYIKNTTEALTEQVATLGMTEDEIVLWKLQQAGATQSVIDSIASMQAQINVSEKQREAEEKERRERDQMKRQSQKALEQNATPEAKYADQMAEYVEWYQKQAISLEDLMRLRAAAAKQEDDLFNRTRYEGPEEATMAKWYADKVKKGDIVGGDTMAQIDTLLARAGIGTASAVAQAQAQHGAISLSDAMIGIQQVGEFGFDAYNASKPAVDWNDPVAAAIEMARVPNLHAGMIAAGALESPLAGVRVGGYWDRTVPEMAGRGGSGDSEFREMNESLRQIQENTAIVARKPEDELIASL